MSREEDRKTEEEQFYWRKVGHAAHKLGLGPDSTDAEVLAHEQKTRAKAQGLEDDSSWFSIFCAELCAGIDPEVPDYCECEQTEWDEDPKRAIFPAKGAHHIFLKRKK